MKTLRITIENAVIRHGEAETSPVPVPTETAIPEASEDWVMFELVDSANDRTIIAIPISNWLHMETWIDGAKLHSQMFSVRPSRYGHETIPPQPAPPLDTRPLHEIMESIRPEPQYHETKGPCQH